MTESKPGQLYYRDGCHLCEELVSKLYRGWPDLLDQFEWRNVDDREDWREAYGLQVPVLIYQGQQLSALVPDLSAVQQRFGAPLIPL